MNTGPQASLLLWSYLLFVCFGLCHPVMVWKSIVHRSLHEQHHPTLLEEERLPSGPDKRHSGPFYVLVYVTFATTENQAGEKPGHHWEKAV